MIRLPAFKAAKQFLIQNKLIPIPLKLFATVQDIEAPIKYNHNVRKTLYVLRTESLNKFKYHAYANYIEGGLWFSAAGVTFLLLPYPHSLVGIFPILLTFKSIATGSTDHFSHNSLNNKNVCVQITLMDNNKLVFTNADGQLFEADYLKDEISLEKALWDEIIAEYNKGTIRYSFSKINIKKPGQDIPSYSAFLLFDKQHSAIGNVEILGKVLSKKVPSLVEAQTIADVINMEKIPRTYSKKTIFQYQAVDTSNLFVNHLPKRLLSGGAWASASAVFFYFGYYYLTCISYWIAMAEVGFVTKYFFKEKFQPIKTCKEINLFDNERVSLEFHDGKKAVTPIASLEILYIDRWVEAAKYYMNNQKPSKMISIKCSYLSEKGKNEDFDLYLDADMTKVENLALLDAILNGRDKEVATFEFKPEEVKQGV